MRYFPCENLCTSRWMHTESGVHSSCEWCKYQFSHLKDKLCKGSIFCCYFTKPLKIEHRQMAKKQNKKTPDSPFQSHSSVYTGLTGYSPVRGKRKCEELNHQQRHDQLQREFFHHVQQGETGWSLVEDQNVPAVCVHVLKVIYLWDVL